MVGKEVSIERPSFRDQPQQAWVVKLAGPGPLPGPAILASGSCEHEWTDPQPGTIRENGWVVAAQQCVHCHTWRFFADWGMTVRREGS